MGQDFGAAAKKFASDHVFGKNVTLYLLGTDKYGRYLGDIELEDGRILNHLLVKEGMAWWYRKYAPSNSILEALEEEARRSKKGLWSRQDSMPPWDWRHQNR